MNQVADHLFTECDKQEGGHDFSHQMGLGSPTTCVNAMKLLSAPILGLKVLASPAVKEATQLYLTLSLNLFDEGTHLLL